MTRPFHIDGHNLPENRKIVRFGAVAQLVERLVRIEEVSGSNPLSSIYEDGTREIRRLGTLPHYAGNCDFSSAANIASQQNSRRTLFWRSLRLFCNG